MKTLQQFCLLSICLFLSIITASGQSPYQNDAEKLGGLNRTDYASLSIYIDRQGDLA